jgi:acyl-coenzyme A synthetase/AMP-(fatty) acid ligase
LTAPSSTTSIGVEEVADATPAGAQLVVTGVPVEKGQEVCAVVIPLCSVDADELVTRSFEQPRGTMCPDGVEIVEALPMGPSRRARRRKLRTRFA